jgi:hypothetical protein
MFYAGRKSREDYCNILLQHYGIEDKLDKRDYFIKSAVGLISHFGLTLRQTERIFSIMALYYASRTNQVTNAFFIVMLSTLKLIKPVLYKKLALGQVSAVQFFEETKLDRAENSSEYKGVSQKWIKNMVDYCLMSDDEFQAATQGDAAQSGLAEAGIWLINYSIERDRVIPFLCNRLDKFALTT